MRGGRVIWEPLVTQQVATYLGRLGLDGLVNQFLQCNINKEGFVLGFLIHYLPFVGRFYFEPH